MQARLDYRIASVLIVVLAVLLCLPAAQSQQRRKKRSRRLTHPVRPQPVPLPSPSNAQNPTDPALVSTADETATNSNTATNVKRRATTSAPESDQERMRRTIDALSTQVTKLSEQLNQVREQQNTVVDLERLSRAEQRAENLRAQLRDVTDKEAALQQRAEQIEYELQPESIDQRAALVGSLNPAAVRDQIRHQLESERTLIHKQLDSLAASHTRLESAISSADTEAEMIRARLNANTNSGANPTGTGDNGNTNTGSTITNTGSNSNTNSSDTTAYPSASPTPPQ